MAPPFMGGGDGSACEVRTRCPEDAPSWRRAPTSVSPAQPTAVSTAGAPTAAASSESRPPPQATPPPRHGRHRACPAAMRTTRTPRRAGASTNGSSASSRRSPQAARIARRGGGSCRLGWWWLRGRDGSRQWGAASASHRRREPAARAGHPRPHPQLPQRTPLHRPPSSELPSLCRRACGRRLTRAGLGVRQVALVRGRARWRRPWRWIPRADGRQPAGGR